MSPLTALDPDAVDKLTARQQLFLIYYLNNGSLQLARKQAEVSGTLWSTWAKDEHFQDILKIIKSPVLFANSLKNAIVWRAFLQHFKLLQHPSAKIQQWAIDNAYKLPGAIPQQEDTTERRMLTQADARQLAAEIRKQLPEGTTLDKSPFEFVDAEEVRIVEGDSNGG